MLTWWLPGCNYILWVFLFGAVKVKMTKYETMKYSFEFCNSKSSRISFNIEDTIT